MLSGARAMLLPNESRRFWARRLAGTLTPPTLLLRDVFGKGAIERREPNFVCHALIAREEVQAAQTDELIDRVYGGSADMLFASLLSRKKLSAEQIAKLKKIVDELE